MNRDIGDKDTVVEEYEVLQEINEQMKEDKVEVVKRLGTVETDWKKLNRLFKTKEKEVSELKNENDKVKENLEAVKEELSKLKVKVNAERKSFEKLSKKDQKNDSKIKLKTETKEPGFACNKCDHKFEDFDKLKSHIRVHHVKTSSTQTDEIIVVDKRLQTECVYIVEEPVKSDKEFENATTKFENYSCFYCNFDIKSERHLEEHIVKCHVEKVNLVKTINYNSGVEPGHVKIKSQLKSIPLPPKLSPQNNPSLVPFGLLPSRYFQTSPYPISAAHLPPVCEHCGWQAGCGTNLVEHKKRVHGDERNPFEVYKFGM